MASIVTLTERKQKYVRARCKGKSQKQAALSAGYSQRVAEVAERNIETPDVKAVFRDIVQRAAGMDLLAKTLVNGLHATETKLASCDGKFTDERTVPDYGARLNYAKLCAEYAGYVMKDEQRSTNLHVITSLPSAAMHIPNTAMQGALDVPAQLTSPGPGPGQSGQTS